VEGGDEKGGEQGPQKLRNWRKRSKNAEGRVVGVLNASQEDFKHKKVTIEERNVGSARVNWKRVRIRGDIKRGGERAGEGLKKDRKQAAWEISRKGRAADKQRGATGGRRDREKKTKKGGWGGGRAIKTRAERPQYGCVGEESGKCRILRLESKKKDKRISRGI